MQIVGVTSDNKRIVSGLFPLFDTHGLPLSIIWQCCIENNFVPSWIDFYFEAIEAGWSHKTILLRLNESIADVYGIEYQEVVIKRLSLIET